MKVRRYALNPQGQLPRSLGDMNLPADAHVVEAKVISGVVVVLIESQEFADVPNATWAPLDSGSGFPQLT